jgi:hypothetical protein
MSDNKHIVAAPLEDLVSSKKIEELKKKVSLPKPYPEDSWVWDYKSHGSTISATIPSKDIKRVEKALTEKK